MIDELKKPVWKWPQGNGKAQFSKELIAQMRKLRTEGLSLKEIAKRCEVGLSSVHKYVYDIPAKGKRKEGWNV